MVMIGHIGVCSFSYNIRQHASPLMEHGGRGNWLLSFAATTYLPIIGRYSQSWFRRLLSVPHIPCFQIGNIESHGTVNVLNDLV